MGGTSVEEEIKKKDINERGSRGGEGYLEKNTKKNQKNAEHI